MASVIGNGSHYTGSLSRDGTDVLLDLGKEDKLLGDAGDMKRGHKKIMTRKKVFGRRKDEKQSSGRF